MPIKKNLGLVKFLLFIITIILLWFIGSLFYPRIDFDVIESSLSSPSFIIGGLVFILLYVILTFFIWFSKDILRLIAAVVFGPYFSTFFIWIAEVINAFILFHFARFFGADFVEKNINRRFKGLEQRLSQINFFWLFMFRAVPLIAFRVMDLAMGLTKIKFSRYLVIVLIGSFLRIFWLQYILSAVGYGIFNNLNVLVEYLNEDKTILWVSLIYLVLVIAVAIKIRKESKKGLWR